MQGSESEMAAREGSRGRDGVQVSEALGGKGGSQLTASKDRGTSVLQPRGTELRQHPHKQGNASPQQSPERNLLTPGLSPQETHTGLWTSRTGR